jgi:cob(I)alamin adenosyltransferase
MLKSESETSGANASDARKKGELGLVHIYTGHGKGKTTASLGLALRAIGHGYRVYMVQFLKGGGYTGELVAADLFLPRLTMRQCGKHCIDESRQMKLGGFEEPKPIMVRTRIDCEECRYCFTIDEEEKEHARRGFALAHQMAESGEFDLVILDEICGAISQGLVTLKQVLELIHSKHEYTELLLTGRDAPEELIAEADYVSHIQSVRHPYEKGIEARKGIEY